MLVRSYLVILFDLEHLKLYVLKVLYWCLIGIGGKKFSFLYSWRYGPHQKLTLILLPKPVPPLSTPSIHPHQIEDLLPQVHFFQTLILLFPTSVSRYFQRSFKSVQRKF